MMEAQLELGPQNPADGPLLRRLRLHQSWYRVAVLGLTRCGTTGGPSPRSLGSILIEEHAAAGLNFISRSALELYRTRRAAGWGVDPRSSAYMTSSQALTINLLGLLSQDDGWLLSWLNVNLGRNDLKRVLAVELEFAPSQRSHHLNDQTRIDALLVVEGKHGAEVVAIEVKYADRFNSRWVDIATPRYRELARRTGLWTDSSTLLASRRFNQLARIHALATSYALSLGIHVPVSLLVLAHRLDSNASALVDEYRTAVSEPLVHGATLEDVCNCISGTAPPRLERHALNLHRRYGSESESAELFTEYL